MEQEQIIQAPVGKCRLAPNNYRRRFDQKKLEELAASMRKVHVLEPLVGRVVKGFDGWEIAFGSRRLRAAGIAGLETVPLIVRELSDDDVLETQIIENSMREDPDPLDEADGFAELVKRGRDAQAIADKIGRSIGYVVQRLKLCDLSKEARKALDEEKITLAVALLLARIPAKLQPEALDELVDDYDDERCATLAVAKKLLETNYLLRLDQAPFDITDAKLVAKAGSCTVCPKRTGQQRELFPDAARADLCTDPVCYRTKLDALWKIRVKSGTQPCLDGKEAQKALGYSSSYEKLNAERYLDSGKRIEVRKLLGTDLPEITLARDEGSGAIVELVPKRAVEAAIDAGRKAQGKRPNPDSHDAYKARQKAADRKLKLRRQAIRVAIEQAVTKAPKVALPDVLELVVRAFAARAWNEVQRDVLERRGVKVKTGEIERQLLKLVRDMKTDAEVAGMGIELAMRAGAPWHMNAGSSGAGSEYWRDGLALVGVDFAAIEKTVAEQAKAKKAGKGSLAKSTPAKGRKREVIHLSDLTGLGKHGTACGAPGTKASTRLSDVTCANCRHAAGGQPKRATKAARKRKARA